MGKETKVIMLVLLRAARVRLQEGSSTYICTALEHTAIDYVNDNSDSTAAERNAVWGTCKLLKQWIAAQLQGCNTLRIWLKDSRNSSPEIAAAIIADNPIYSSCIVAKRLKETRIAWIDAMIAELL